MLSSLSPSQFQCTLLHGEAESLLLIAGVVLLSHCMGKSWRLLRDVLMQQHLSEASALKENKDQEGGEKDQPLPLTAKLGLLLFCSPHGVPLLLSLHPLCFLTLHKG